MRNRIEGIFGDLKSIYIGLTNFKLKNNILTITHTGNMGNTLYAVDKNIKKLGLKRLRVLKKELEVLSEKGSPDYYYEIRFRL